MSSHRFFPDVELWVLKALLKLLGCRSRVWSRGWRPFLLNGIAPWAVVLIVISTRLTVAFVVVLFFSSAGVTGFFWGYYFVVNAAAWR